MGISAEARLPLDLSLFHSAVVVCRQYHTGQGQCSSFALEIVFVIDEKVCADLWWTQSRNNNINALVHNSYNGKNKNKRTGMHFHRMEKQDHKTRNKIQWKSDIHLISKCKFKSSSHHPRTAHLFKLFCDALLVWWWMDGMQQQKKWVSNLLAATCKQTTNNRDSLQWWIVLLSFCPWLCLLLLLMTSSAFNIDFP